MAGEQPSTTIPAEAAAAEEEPSIAEMITNLHKKFAEIEAIEGETLVFIEDWVEAMTFYAGSKKEFERQYPKDIDHRDNGHHPRAVQELLEVDMEAAACLTKIYKNARREYTLVDELEIMAAKLKVNSFVELGDSGVYELAEEAERKVQQCREDLLEGPGKLVKLRQEIFDEA